MTFCQHEFGLKKTSVHNYMAVAQRYGERDGDGKLTGVLAQDFEKHSYSSLAHMLPLEKVLPPTAGRKQILEALKAKKELQHVEQDKNSAPSGKKSNVAETVEGDAGLRQPAMVIQSLPGIPMDKVFTFKGDKAREEFLDTWKTWPLWLDVPPLNLKIYRCKISGGSWLAAFETWGYSYTEKKDVPHLAGFFPFEGEQFNFDFYKWSKSAVRDRIRENKLSAYLPLPEAVDFAEVERLNAELKAKYDVADSLEDAARIHEELAAEETMHEDLAAEMAGRVSRRRVS
jgi:hypothetical protein